MTFQPKFVNVIDPTNPANNLGKSVHYKVRFSLSSLIVFRNQTLTLSVCSYLQLVTPIQNAIAESARRWRAAIVQLADPMVDAKPIIYTLFNKVLARAVFLGWLALAYQIWYGC